MVLNPLGAVRVYDFGNPKVITGYARETISGGQFVIGSSVAGVVTSGLDSFTTSDITFVTGGSALAVNGIALNTATSGNLISVAVDGAFIVTAAGTILPGYTVAANGDDAIVQASTAGTTVGRAITDAGSEGFCLANFTF
jgi:hypothetical protein